MVSGRKALAHIIVRHLQAANEEATASKCQCTYLLFANQHQLVGAFARYSEAVSTAPDVVGFLLVVRITSQSRTLPRSRGAILSEHCQRRTATDCKKGLSDAHESCCRTPPAYDRTQSQRAWRQRRS